MTTDLTKLGFDELRPPSPVFTADHQAWGQRVRAFVEKHVAPQLEVWDREGSFPDELYLKAAGAGILGMGFPEQHGGVRGTNDLQHRILFAEEFHRLGTGVVFADLATHWIGLPPVIQAGDPLLLDTVVKPVLAGQKKISFAVTEPTGGSDVARLRSTARRTDTGWAISGTKTLVSGCLRADFVLLAARVDRDHGSGISLFLVDMNSPGVSRERVPGLQWYNASIGSITLDHVTVPSENLIGPVGGGFKMLAQQFNIERFSGVGATLAMGRACVSEAIEFARQRETFGQRLIDHQVIRHKLVDMIRRLQAAYSYLDHNIWAFETGHGGPAQLSMLKVQATTTLEKCAREALHILGGSAYAGRSRAERIFRESRIFALGGGTEEVLRDLTGRQLGF